jgi:hypothetical protein
MIAIYSANFGGYDDIYEPKVLGKDCGYYYFVERERCPSKSNWTLMPSTSPEDPILANRSFKWTPHVIFPKVKYSLYLDANLQLMIDPNALIQMLGQGDILIHAHHDRHSVNQEADAIIQWKKKGVTREKLDLQLAYLKEQGFTDGKIDKVHLPWASFIFRKHSPKVTACNNFVTNQLFEFTIRDQMAFGYAAWRSRVKITWVPQSIKKSGLVKGMKHLQ